MIQNPNYKGKWKPPLIDNPEYDVSFNSCGCLIMPLVKLWSLDHHYFPLRAHLPILIYDSISPILGVLFCYFRVNGLQERSPTQLTLKTIPPSSASLPLKLLGLNCGPCRRESSLTMSLCVESSPLPTTMPEMGKGKRPKNSPS